MILGSQIFEVYPDNSKSNMSGLFKYIKSNDNACLFENFSGLFLLLILQGKKLHQDKRHILWN